jgi:chromosomal replication initiation ATPase DnaA
LAQRARKRPLTPVRQSHLDFGHASFAPETYLESPQNEKARRALDTWQTWPGGVMALVGENGAGKSHLASVWAQQVGAPVVEAKELDLPLLAQLSAKGSLRAVIEHGDTCDTMVLFSLLTTLEREGGAVLLVAEMPPPSWPYKLLDLVSRLHAISVTSLPAPEVDLLARLIVRQSAARGYKIDEAASTYLAQRLPRTFAATLDIVACMDEVVSPTLKTSQALAQRALQAFYGNTDDQDEMRHGDLFDL